MDINNICKKLEQIYNCSAVYFSRYNESYAVRAMDKSKKHLTYRYFVVKGDEISEILDEALLNYFKKDEITPSDIVY